MKPPIIRLIWKIWLFIGTFLCLQTSVEAQLKACDVYVITNGIPQKATVVQVNTAILEASTQELAAASSTDPKYRSQIFIYGQIDKGPDATKIVSLTMRSRSTLLDPNKFFKIETDPADPFTKYIRLVNAIDRDGFTGIDTDDYDFLCKTTTSTFDKTIPAFINILDTNDNAPSFIQAPYSTSVNELTPIQNTVFREIAATDADEVQNSIVDFELSPVESGIYDATQYFTISFPRYGYVVLKKALDYEAIIQRPYFLLNVTAYDNPKDPKLQQRSYTTLRIDVTDGDDLPPTFEIPNCLKFKLACVNPQYTATIISDGAVPAALQNVNPAAILAKDQDSLNAKIQYSITNVNPSSLLSAFIIDAATGVITQKTVISRTASRQVEIYVKAQEVSINERYEMATVTVTVSKNNNNNPKISSSLTGFNSWIRENSAKGTATSNAAFTQMFQLIVTDADIAPCDPEPKYLWTVTGTSLFKISKDGYILVDTDVLDYEQPLTQVSFKVTVTEDDTIERKTDTVDVIVNVVDVNDNAPRFTESNGYKTDLKESRIKLWWHYWFLAWSTWWWWGRWI